jgi:hypothetical protein
MSFATKVVLGIVTTKHPTTGKQIGKRLVASFQNKAAYDMLSGDYVQSHAPKYRLTESGDHPRLDEKHVENWTRWVERTYKVKF